MDVQQATLGARRVVRKERAYFTYKEAQCVGKIPWSYRRGPRCGRQSSAPLCPSRMYFSPLLTEGCVGVLTRPGVEFERQRSPEALGDIKFDRKLFHRASPWPLALYAAWRR